MGQPHRSVSLKNDDRGAGRVAGLSYPIFTVALAGNDVTFPYVGDFAIDKTPLKAECISPVLHPPRLAFSKELCWFVLVKPRPSRSTLHIMMCKLHA